jgi:nicotinamidase-related amidase
VLIAGAVTSLCIDTAGREAADLGYRVYILKDCTVGRTTFEREYYANEIMPLYAKVVNASDIESALEC